MIFVPTFLRSFDFVLALRQSSLIVFLLSSILCFFVSSYTIDNSCRRFNGQDITGDIEQAINNVKEMARDAFVATATEAPRVDNLLATLFGTDQSRYNTVVEYFSRVSTLGPTDDIVVNCGDERVKRKKDKWQEPPDPLGVWIDYRYHWFVGFSSFQPCDPAARNLADLAPHGLVKYAYTISQRVIYLCPKILDFHLRQSLAPYKDDDNTGRFIDDFVSLPFILFHEILHTSTFKRKPSSRRWNLMLILLTRDNPNSH